MKKIVIPSSLKQIEDTHEYCDGYLIGIEDLSVNLPIYFKLGEIKKIKNIIQNKELFISLNKNMRNGDLDNLKLTLLELEKYDIKGILFYDISVLSLKNKLNLKNKLVWAQEHATTNYSTINYWNEKGADYTYLSNEVTKNEILEISKNTNSKLMIQVFGYIPMFISKRHLITNYLKYFNIDDHSKMYYMAKEGNSYPVIESKDGTEVYSAKILNAHKDYLIFKNNIEYSIFNSFLIEEDKFVDILKNFEDQDEKTIDLILNYNTFDGFMNKKTVYKVKNI